jgi:hypothetical protein
VELRGALARSCVARWVTPKWWSYGHKKLCCKVGHAEVVELRTVDAVVDDLGGRVIADHAYRYHTRLSPYKHHHSAGAHDRTTCTAAQAAGTTAPSFKSPAIAEDIAGYSCLRLVKLRAIFHYIPLYLYLTSAIAILEVIRYVPLAGDLKPCTATPLVAQPSFVYAPHFYRGAGGYPLRSTIRQQRNCFYYHPVAAKTHTMMHPRPEAEPPLGRARAAALGPYG